MSKVKSEMATRCELALMGKVIPCTTEEVQSMTEYIYKVLGKDPSKIVNIVENTIQKYSKYNEVKYIVCNTVHGMRCITYLLECSSDNEEDLYPVPLTDTYGTGYPCAFCYVFNIDSDWCSEFGDCFFQKKSDGFYYRVS